MIGDAMAELESLEFGKADFVLLDTVSMPEFMANLRLRYRPSRSLLTECNSIQTPWNNCFL
uniref:Uncharacterized protein n=1 Tax=Naja naja TaxID=35670 RepID=A0A8C6XCZ4_NAJNA